MVNADHITVHHVEAPVYPRISFFQTYHFWPGINQTFTAMSSYNMASMHSKWSKQVAMPVGDRWGIPVGTSVADCLNWNYGAKPQPPTQPKPEVQVRSY